MNNICLRGRLLSLASPKVMGIVNYTDDSFFPGSRCNDEAAILRKVEKMLAEGADIIDLGVVSSRPGAELLDAEVEAVRVRESVSAIVREFPDALLSVDTWRASVAEIACGEGACIINDISGGTFDEAMLDTVARLKVPYVLMHTTDVPARMQQQTDYKDLLSDIYRYFAEKIQYLTTRGFSDIILDVGFGFGKTMEQNYRLLQNLSFFQSLHFPLLVGISRKSMIYKALDVTPEEALEGTTALHFAALQNGASILRVHDVKAAKQVCRLWEKCR